MNQQQFRQTWSSNDFKISAYLRAKKIPFVGINKTSKPYLFIFQNKPEIQKLIDAFWRDDKLALVNPRQLFAEIDFLKQLLYSDYPMKGEEK